MTSQAGGVMQRLISKCYFRCFFLRPGVLASSAAFAEQEPPGGAPLYITVRACDMPPLPPRTTPPHIGRP